MLQYLQIHEVFYKARGSIWLVTRIFIFDDKNVIIQVMTKLLNVTVREINDVIWRPQPGLDRRALSVECLINTTGKDRAARWLRYESEAQSTNMPLDVSLRHATCRERLIGCSPR